MNTISKYRNGNYSVVIFNDGTRVKATTGDKLIAAFPDSFDCKITNYCDMNCPWCHENSTNIGLDGDILNAKFIETLQPFTEIAIGGGNPLAHPDLVKFLVKLKKQNIIANITVNLNHFLDDIDFLTELTNNHLIYGLGISYNSSMNLEVIKEIQKFPNSVIHIINGIISIEELKKMREADLKILILGYKNLRRGKSYNELHDKEILSRQKDLYTALPQIIKENWFKVVSFDNLALTQLDVKRFLTLEEWNQFYQGEDGESSMYIDLVKNEFAKSSISSERFPLMDDIKEMFKLV